MHHCMTFMALLAETSETRIHPLGLAAVLILGFATLMVPRSAAAIPIFMMACFVAPGQKLIIASIDFNMVRIMVIFCWVRIISRQEYVDFRWTRLDRVLLAWAATSVVAYTLLHASFGALVNRLGLAYDLLGMYFFFRCSIRTWSDLDRFLRAVVLVSIPVLVAFLVERATGRNVFSFFGGVREITKIRNGRLRCQGAYQNAILAGAFWAPLLPLVAARLWRGQLGRAQALLGIGAVGTIVVLSSSSTPVTGVLAGMIGAGAFLFRRELGKIRAVIILILLTMHIVMDSPIWHLVARVDLAGGSTGYHRYLLIDQFVKRIDEWWLFGAKSTAHWGWDMWDVANQYVTAGVTGGLLGFVLFCWMLWCGFQGVGRLWRGARERYTLMLSWALGCALFAQCVMFIGAGISHSNQNLLIFFVNLAAISNMELYQRRERARRRWSQQAARLAA